MEKLLSQERQTQAPEALNPDTLKDSSRTLFKELLKAEMDNGELVLVDKYLGQRKPDFMGPNAVCVSVYDNSFYHRTLTGGSLGLGEAYMAKKFDVENDDVTAFTTLLLKANLDQKIRSNYRFMAKYLTVLCKNFLKQEYSNVRAHYDIGQDLFDVFLLDEFMVYSCGYAKDWDDDVDTLQKNKLKRICQKLELKRGERLLDIGCGNGGLLVYAALHYGVSGSGYTTSIAHTKKARQLVKKYHLEDKIHIETGDFDQIEGEFDKIVSVGMLEHVRAVRYKNYFSKIKQLLTDKGLALVHAIGANSNDRSHDPFIQKYIFPGSDTPSLSDFSRNIEKQNMAVLDVENMVRHYAVTTRRWLEAFDKNKDQLPADKYDDHFKRMWRFYLSIGISAALFSRLGVFQVLFNKDYGAQRRFQRI